MHILSRILNKVAYMAPGGLSVRPWLQRLRGVQMGNGVWLAQAVYIDDLHPEDLTIGDNSSVGYGTAIFTHTYPGPKRSQSNGKVVIEEEVFVGPRCLILPNVRIGRGSVIKAGTVVSSNVPPSSFFGNPPAQILGEVTVPMTMEHEYEEFVRGLRPKRPVKR